MTEGAEMENEHDSHNQAPMRNVGDGLHRFGWNGFPGGDSTSEVFQ